jgi:hypothetical protein
MTKSKQKKNPFAVYAAERKAEKVQRVKLLNAVANEFGRAARLASSARDKVDDARSQFFEANNILHALENAHTLPHWQEVVKETWGESRGDKLVKAALKRTPSPYGKSTTFSWQEIHTLCDELYETHDALKRWTKDWADLW